MTRIIEATEAHLRGLVPLFDQYRIFYKQVSDLAAAESFLRDRMNRKETTVFIALQEGKVVGFTQLYKSFSSVSLQPVFILNDLFVNGSFRHQGIGGQLLKRAQHHCMEKQYRGLALETAVDNPARYLYERLGWKKDSHCFHYFWKAG
jgi:GNAT superfamily N-acetyltransferase